MKRGQDVWVKVLSVSDKRISLSMRDVDQATGQDLLPGARMPVDGVNPAGPAGCDPAAAGGLRGLSGIKVCLALPDLHSVQIKQLLLPAFREAWGV